ncbi:YdaU family protein [Janthinobacterium sp.]|uniref:YdaU family protein n=1 Tax=Janthinobacterium sp. TaxID=1871054 RepID=UPI0026061C8B|nr:YdaU family protein [Janthinobacterium sp.]
MNYFEHHIGDYAEATSHLSFIEDAAYSRCIRKYYAKEKPLPADLGAVQRLVGARTKEERAAVDAVLQEFFVLREDGWHNDRCNATIERYQSGEPEREAKKANEDLRLKRHREERASLFAELHAAGRHAAWNVGIRELRALVAALHASADQPLPATAPATPATATQYPITNNQSPIYKTLSEKFPDVEISIAPLPEAKEAQEKRRHTDDDEKCARWLFGRVLANNANAKQPNIAIWANEVRLLRERDKRTHAEICELFQWAQGDAFWRSNILSPAKLREKWDQLTMKRTPLGGKATQHGNFGKQDYHKGVGADGTF